MSFHPNKLNIVSFAKCGQAFPQVHVWCRLISRVTPAFTPPIFNPTFVHSIHDVTRVGKEFDRARLFECGKCFNGSEKFHSVVGRALVSAGYLFALLSPKHHRAVATASGIAFARTICIDDDLWFRRCLFQSTMRLNLKEHLFTNFDCKNSTCSGDKSTERPETFAIFFTSNCYLFP